MNGHIHLLRACHRRPFLEPLEAHMTQLYGGAPARTGKRASPPDGTPAPETSLAALASEAAAHLPMAMPPHLAEAPPLTAGTPPLSLAAPSAPTPGFLTGASATVNLA